MNINGHSLTPAELIQQRELDKRCREKVMAACPVQEGEIGIRGYIGMEPCFWCSKPAPAVVGWKCPGCGKAQPQRSMATDDGGPE